MTGCDLDDSVPDWLIDHPETLAVFERLGVDHSCGGKSLAYACREAGLDPEDVLARLRRAVEQARAGGGPARGRVNPPRGGPGACGGTGTSPDR